MTMNDEFFPSIIKYNRPWCAKRTLFEQFINVKLSESKYKSWHVFFYSGDLQAAKVFMKGS
jgi:hypothetical protein